MHRRNRRLTRFAPYYPAYLLALSVIIPVVIGQKSAHPGFALGLVTIITSLLILAKGVTTRGASLWVYGSVFAIVVLLGVIAVASFRDPGEIWLTTCFAVFSILLAFDMLTRLWSHRS
ncbi:hypothetical protein JZ785_20375 [Alicyclobacillus curvatus]|nr:hypothetical protein JZ785_20375 [Alicyclobacillus curvatus]